MSVLGVTPRLKTKLGYLPHLMNLCGPVLRPPSRYSSVSISAFSPLTSANVPVSAAVTAVTATATTALATAPNPPELAPGGGGAFMKKTVKSKTGTGLISGILSLHDLNDP